jgi:hypothetical protein
MDSDNNQTEIATVPAEEALIHQGAKLVLGTLAGFLAGVAVRITYDAVRSDSRRPRSPSTTRPSPRSELKSHSRCLKTSTLAFDFFKQRIKMLKKQITYKDFNDNDVTETFYFNLTKAELVELEVEFKGGMTEMINRIIEANDNKAIVQQFKKIILLAYGVKSDDGKRFIKSEDLSREFEQTNAYSELFVELATNSDAGAEFIIGIVPSDLGEEIKKTQASDQPANIPPPPPPVPPTTPID